MTKKADTGALARWMDKGKGIKEPPAREQAGHNLEQPEHAPARSRKKSERTARVEVRVTADERRRFELNAIREDVTASELFSRMLALYEREHGRFEVRRANEKD